MREKLLSKTVINEVTIEYFSEPGGHFLIVVSNPDEYASQVYSDKKVSDQVHQEILCAISGGCNRDVIMELLKKR